MWTILDWTNPDRLGSSRQWHGYVVKPLTAGQSAGATEEERAKAVAVARILRDKLLPNFFLRRSVIAFFGSHSLTRRILFAQQNEGCYQRPGIFDFAHFAMRLFIRDEPASTKDRPSRFLPSYRQADIGL
jgi:hypothetical protein